MSEAGCIWVHFCKKKVLVTNTFSYQKHLNRFTEIFRYTPYGVCYAIISTFLLLITRYCYILLMNFLCQVFTFVSILVRSKESKRSSYTVVMDVPSGKYGTPPDHISHSSIVHTKGKWLTDINSCHLSISRLRLLRHSTVLDTDKIYPILSNVHM